MEMLDLLLHSSSSVFLLGGVLLLVYVVFTTSFSSQRETMEPPGPRPLPLLGNLLQLGLTKSHHTFSELSRKYGPVFTVYYGPYKVVVLAGFKTVREALVNYADEFGEKAVPLTAREFSQGHGVIWANGESWKEMRRFTLMNLKDFGMGKRTCEDKIAEECHFLLDVIKSFKGEAFDTTRPTVSAVSNIICSIVYGSRFEHDDPQFTSMSDQMARRLRLMGSASIQLYNLFPWIGRWVANRRQIQKIISSLRKQNLALFRRLKQTLDPQMCRGFVDAFMVQQQRVKDSEESNSHFHSENLMITVLNLFAAGTESTATTLRWGLLFMAKYPQIQDQVHDELSRVVGSRQVRTEDRKNLPFTDAVVHEVQRLANIIAVGITRRTTRDVVFQGYSIKKGTTVFGLLSSVLYDETEWESPHTFYPAHFLDKDGKFVKREAFMPFAAGRRVCIGEALARMELFIFFSSLLQHFRFTPPPGISEDQLDLTPQVGFTLSPPPHKLCAVPLV